MTKQPKKWVSGSRGRRLMGYGGMPKPPSKNTDPKPGEDEGKK